MSDDWYNGLDLGKLVGLVFIDLKKAFDTVDHDILCKKLEFYGVQQRELSWFRSYLSNRKEFCRVNGVDSDVGEIEVGVPQGSCLGPLLFLIYGVFSRDVTTIGNEVGGHVGVPRCYGIN